MGIELIHIGFGNYLAMNRVIAIASSDSVPIRRMIEEAKEKGLLIDMTKGRKKRAAVIMDSEHVILAASIPETFASRYVNNKDGLFSKSEQEDESEESEKPILVPS